MLSSARGMAAVFALVLPLTAIVGPAANADGTYGSTVQVTTHDVSTPPAGGCVTPRYRVSNTQPRVSDFWEADIEITAPDGTSYDTDYYYGSAPSEDFAALLMCSVLDAAGTYTVNVRWETYDSNLDMIESGMTTGHFKYVKQRKASCQITTKKWAYGSSGWGFKGRLLRDGSAYANRKVDVQVRVAGSWRHLGPKKLTNRRGIATWHTDRSIPRNRYLFKLRFDGNSSTKACSSDSFRLPRR